MSRKLALIIGNSEYEDSGLARLIKPGADAAALAEVFRDPDIGAFDEVTALINQPAATIRRAIAAFFAGRGREDLLVLYFSGHGIRDDRGKLFLAVKDTEHKLLAGTAIPANFITEEMDYSRSRRQVLILDCCHSGAFSQGMKAAPGASVGTATAFEGTGAGRIVLTATDSTQYAWEGDHVIGQAENSVFTHYLVQGLRSGQADVDGDGRITLDELYNYVYEQVVEETPVQTPGKWSYGQQGEIVIARNPRPVVRPVDLPHDLQQTIEDPRPWVRSGAVQELERILQGSNRGLAQAAYAALSQMTEDDSRRVASMASAALEGHEQSHLNDAAEPPAQAHTSQPQPRPVQATAGAAPPVGKPAAAHHPAEKMAGAGFKQRAASVTRAVAQSSLARRPVLLTSAGWGFGTWIAIILAIVMDSSSPNLGLLGGVIAGLITGIVLRWVQPKVRWTHILLIAAGWAVGMGLHWGSSSLLYSFNEEIRYNYGTASAWFASAVISGTIGGLATGLALRSALPSFSWMGVGLITAAWVIALFLGEFSLGILFEENASPTSLAVLGIIAGAAGSALTFALLDKLPHPTTT